MYAGMMYLLDSPDTSLSFANPLVEETVINNDSSVLTRGETGNASSTNDDTVSVSMESLSASWNYRSDKNVLHNITFEVNQVSEMTSIQSLIYLLYNYYLRKCHCWQ